MSLPVLTLYGAALLQGLFVVSFPATSETYLALHGFSDDQYGAIYLPLAGFAVVGATIGAAIARRVGLKALLLVSLLLNAVSQALLATTGLVGAGTAYAALLAGTSILGLAFGLFGAPLNSLPGLFFPARKDTALVAAHSVFGLGFAIGPLLATLFTALGEPGSAAWIGFPITLIVLAALNTASAVVARLPSEAPVEKPSEATRTSDQAQANTGGTRPLATPTFWLLLVIGIVYAFAEGTFANWAVAYLAGGKGIDGDAARLALSAFWFALVIGRVATSWAVSVVRPEAIWIALPLLMIAAFLLMPLAETGTLGILLFAFAGFACSAFFPLTVSIMSRTFPAQVSFVSSLMVASLMIGVGVGTFVLGALRSALEFETLYRVSALYPTVALALALVVLVIGRARSRTP